MAQTLLARIRFKLHSLFLYAKHIYYKALGLRVGKGSVVGSIKCDWLGSLIIGNNCSIMSGSSFWIKNPFLKDNCIEIGDNVFIGRNCDFNCSKRITIGNNCLIASNTIIVDVNHGIEKDYQIYQQPITADEIIIEEDVWIGAGAIILKGVRIGKGSVVAAGAVVIKSILPYEIWGGVPARKIGIRK